MSCWKYHLFKNSDGGLNLFFMYVFFSGPRPSCGTMNDFLSISLLLGCVSKYVSFVTSNGPHVIGVTM